MNSTLPKPGIGNRQNQVLWAAKHGGLKTLGLTPEDLKFTVGGGYTVVHIAARWGHLDEIPRQLLTPALLSAPNAEGLTVVQIAARWGHLGQLPPELLPPEVQSTSEDEGDGVTDIAGQWGRRDNSTQFLASDAPSIEDAAPPKWVEDSRARARSGEVFTAIRKGQFGTIELTPEDLASRPGGANPMIFDVIRYGRLGQIPVRLLTAEVLSVTNAEGDNAVHVLARWGHLDRIPAQLLTDELMDTPNAAAQTPRALAQAAERGKQVLKAAKEGRLKDIVLTVDDLKYKGRGGNTVAHVAAYWGHLGQIRHLLTYEIRRTENDERRRPDFLAPCSSSDLRRCSVFASAFHGRLGTLMLSEEDLRFEDELQTENRVAHEAASRGTLGDIPAHLLTRPVVTMSNVFGECVVSIARKQKCLSAIPNDVLEKVMRTPRWWQGLIGTCYFRPEKMMVDLFGEEYFNLVSS
jgi:hypothetical protein